MGYAGGLVSITAALVLFVQTDTPFLGLDKSTAEHVRIVGPMTAVWLLVFALPRISTFRVLVLNHLIHHRGQLSVYLRMRGVALPPIYGPVR